MDTPVDAAERYHQARFTWDQMCGLETIPTADATDGVLTVRFPQNVLTRTVTKKVSRAIGSAPVYSSVCLLR